MMSQLKSIRIAALAVGGVLSVGVFAQTPNVTLYGAVDLAIERVDNGSSHVARMASGRNTISRFGFLGSEDLGGGLKAHFRLESAVNADDGTTNAKFFNRFSYVGLDSSYGSLDLGRMYSPTYIIGIASDPFVRNGTSLIQTMFLAQTSATASVVIPSFIDNSLKYTSPRWNNIWGEAMYTFGEAPNSNSSGDGSSVSLQYLKGPLYLGYGYQALRSGSSTAVVANPLNIESHVLGVRYTLGTVTLYGHMNRNFAAGAPNSTNSAASVAWQVSGPHTLFAQMAHRSVSRADADSTGVLFGYNYALSRRSTIYARMGKIANESQSNVALNGYALTASGKDPKTLSLGISHVF